MANILHTIYNTSTTLSAVVNSFTFATDSHIQHHADLSTFGLSSDFTSSSTIATISANYEKGGLYRKSYSTATFAVVQTITGYDGTTLMVSSTADLVGKESWEGNGVYSGTYIVSITSATWLVMSNTPSSPPTISGSIQFSTSTNELTLSGTTPTLGMGPDWTILGNGYNSAGTVISVKNSYTLIVDNLPDSTPTVGSPMTFRAPGVGAANTITVTSSAGLSTGFIASGNGFTLDQYITNINGNILTMSAEPNVVANDTPAYNTSINFSNLSATLYTIPTSSSVSFNLNYTNINGTTGHPTTPYVSTLTIKITQGTQQTLTVRNYVSIDAAPVPPPPPTYTGGGGGRGGGGVGLATTSYGPISGISQAPGEQGRESMGKDSSVGTSIGSGSVGGSGFGSGGSNGNATCFVLGSLVTLADKTKVAIEDVKIGDFVLGLDGINKVVGYDRPMLIIDNIRDGNLYGFNGSEKFITSEHPVMTKQGWKAIDQINAVRVDPHLDKILIGNLNVGDEVLCEDGSYVTINSIEKYEDQPQQELYNLLLDGDHTFYVNDLLVHNKGDSPAGCTCYLAGSTIAMADGRFVNIEDVKVGDKVLGAFGEINEILALMHVKLGDRQMYKLNQEHDTTYEEIHISTDKKMLSIDNDATYSEYGEYWNCILGDGTEQMLLNVGVSRERLHTLTKGTKLQTISGPRVVNSLEAYNLPPDTILYNFVLNGSHTFFVNDYAVASWPREDDFDYDQWKPKVK